MKPYTWSNRLLFIFINQLFPLHNNQLCLVDDCSPNGLWSFEAYHFVNRSTWNLF